MERKVNYDGRRFRTVSNSAGGEVGDGPVFDYGQKGRIVWAMYRGGGIGFGTLIAMADETGRLDMRYQHVNAAGELRTGACASWPEVLPDGRLRLRERWRWTGGAESEGLSVVEEVGKT